MSYLTTKEHGRFAPAVPCESTLGNCSTEVAGHVIVLFSLAFLPHRGQNLYFSCIHAPQNLQNMMSAFCDVDCAVVDYP